MAEVGYFLNKRDKRNFLDMMRQRSRLRSGPGLDQRRRRNPRGSTTSSSSSSTEEIFGLLVKSIGKYQFEGFSKIIPGFATKAVIVLSRYEFGSSMYFSTAKYEAYLEELSSSESEDAEKPTADDMAIDAVNPIWPMNLTAGTGEENFSSEESGPQDTFQAQPIIVKGYLVINPDSDDGSEVSESESSELYTPYTFVITDVILPITLIAGYTTAAVDGGDFDIDNITVLWGRNPYVEAQSDSTEKPVRVTNPDLWTSDAAAYAVAMQLDDGTFYGLDLACKQEAGSESET